MTRRTIPIDFPFHMAGDAEAHVRHVVHLEDLRHSLDVAMTGAAGVGSHRLNVPTVREVHVPRQRMNAGPLQMRFGGIALVGPELAQLLDFRLAPAVAPRDDHVAAHAGLEARDARLIRYAHAVVAVLALDLVLAGVDVVTEKDGLAGTVEV